MKTLKQHPIAWSIYALYLLGWIWFGYIAFINFYYYGDGNKIANDLYHLVIFAFLPYLVITFLISEFATQSRPFYLLLIRCILGSVPVVIITGVILDSLIK